MLADEDLETSDDDSNDGSIAEEENQTEDHSNSSAEDNSGGELDSEKENEIETNQGIVLFHNLTLSIMAQIPQVE